MCLNNTELFDEANNDEADRHAQMMRKQREGWDGKTVTFAGGKTYEIKDDNGEK